MDRANFNIFKQKNIPTTVRIVNRNEKTNLQTCKDTKKSWRIHYNLQPIIRSINRKIMLVFHYFAYIETNGCQLFCTGYIENLDKAVEIYENFT